MTRKKGLAAIALLVLVAAALLSSGRGVPYPTRESRWAIGLYGGASPLRLAPDPAVTNPVLTAAQVTDVPARFVADPFLLRRDATWFLFFEVWNEATQRGEIAVARSPDARQWRYDGVVLAEPFHLSYPYVFESQDTVYLMPESAQARAVRLYRADPFPSHWSFVQTLLHGEAFSDPSIVEHGGRWWLFVASHPETNARLDLYFADRPDGPWQAHPMNPIVHDDPHHARPGGRIVADGERVFRFAQDDAPHYGVQVWAFEVTTLSESAYAEQPIGDGPVVAAGESGWNARGMHHVDPQRIGPEQWLAAVDGSRATWGLRFWSWR
jgi:hypothetical protein